ncbi:hypothetical protein [Nocardia nova]|uniref:hypothetical protein n=1 Tax=Nocardia nova TaxID=37330 RepID=UPI0015E32EA7|nr:hypothetical protein [Nocardia nova]
MHTVVSRLLEIQPGITALLAWAVLFPVTVVTLLIAVTVLVAVLADQDRSTRAQHVLRELLVVLLALLRTGRR